MYSTNKRIIAEIVNGEEVVMTIDKNMLSCEFGALDRGNIDNVVNFGLYANRGSISFIDTVGYFNNNYIDRESFKNNTVKLFLAKDNAYQIATFDVDDFSFDDESKEVNVNLISKIQQLQNTPSSAFGQIVMRYAESSGAI